MSGEIWGDKDNRWLFTPLFFAVVVASNIVSAPYYTVAMPNKSQIWTMLNYHFVTVHYKGGKCHHSTQWIVYFIFLKSFDSFIPNLVMVTLAMHCEPLNSLKKCENVMEFLLFLLKSSHKPLSGHGCVNGRNHICPLWNFKIAVPSSSIVINGTHSCVTSTIEVSLISGSIKLIEKNWKTIECFLFWI